MSNESKQKPTKTPIVIESRIFKIPNKIYYKHFYSNICKLIFLYSAIFFTCFKIFTIGLSLSLIQVILCSCAMSIIIIKQARASIPRVLSKQNVIVKLFKYGPFAIIDMLSPSKLDTSGCETVTHDTILGGMRNNDKVDKLKPNGHHLKHKDDDNVNKE